MSTTNRPIMTRVDDALAEKIEKAAAGERRPVSQFVRNVLEIEIARREQNADPRPKPEIAA
jgi:uncharacterized protein (DUF1778 family)